MAHGGESSQNDEEILKARGLNPPRLSRLHEMSERYGLNCSAEDLGGYQECFGDILNSFRKIAELPEPKPIVKYPRTPGYRPKPEDNPFNAWYWRCDIHGAPSGKLAGKNVAIKDSIMVAGVPMMNGSLILEGFVPDMDATVVTRILDAGGHIIGKPTCEDLCFSACSHTSATGPVRNPHNEAHCIGGSSTGCAALLTAGKVDLAIGGDQGGSVRNPAGWAGIVGLKPTFGLVPCTGAASMEYRLDHLGPMARTVYDCALLLEVIAGYDPLDDRTHKDMDIPNYTEMLTGDIKGMKVGVLTEGFLNTDKQIEQGVRDVIYATKQLGTVVEEISIPQHAYALNVHGPVVLQGFTEWMIQTQGGGIGHRSYYPTSLGAAMRKGYSTLSSYLSHPMKLMILAAEHVRQEVGFQLYCKGQNILREITEQYNKALQKYDVLVMPTATYLPPKIPREDAPISEHIRNAFDVRINTAIFNSTGHPALSVPAGLSEPDKLPFGLMIVGRHFDEATVLNYAYAVEKLKDKQ